MFIGDHNYSTHPTTTTEPAMANVAQSAETVARNSNAWIRIDIFVTKLTAGNLSVLGLYRLVTTVNDLYTFVGQYDAAGNKLSTDGMVRIYHVDFSS